MMHKERSPYVAVLLSLVAPGLGHVFAGDIVPGLALCGANVAVGMLGTVSIVATPSLARAALLAAAVGWGALWLGAAAGAYRAASRRDGSRQHDRWYVYVVLAALSFASATTWAVAVRERVVEVFRIPGASMEPNIAPGSRLLVDKTAYRKGPIHRGDVVVFTNPDERYQAYIKRVVALPGDTIEIRDDRVVINGTKLEYGAVPSAMPSVLEERNADTRYRIALAPSEGPRSPSTLAAVTVPSGHCFLLGDNRRQSVDSRSIGPVPLTDIVGRVWRPW
ncbi:MAG TPA: signal peptidase I [Polyangiaceae bacterium]|jgi:signal peptidase I|nr:signal peptidase I [Polyangiaceae bacterium]